MSDLLFVTGATGKIGRHVCRHALDRGMRVRAMTRDPARAADLADRGADVVTGALGDEDVAAKMAGADAAFVMVPLGPDTLELGRATHDALEEAGVDRAVRLSVVGTASSTSTSPRVTSPPRSSGPTPSWRTSSGRHALSGKVGSSARTETVEPPMSPRRTSPSARSRWWRAGRPAPVRTT